MTATKKATEITIINRADGTVQGHRAGCRDIARARKADGIFGSEPWTFAWQTKHAAWVDYNSDFLAEGPESGQWDIEWLPCADHLPQGAPDTYESYLTNDLGQPAADENTTTKENDMTAKPEATETKTSTPNVRTYDTASKALRIKALGVDCTIPYCRATPDESCRSAKGLEVEPHTRRVQKALAMEKAAAKRAAKAAADPKAASKAAAKPAAKKASTKKATKADSKAEEFVAAKEAVEAAPVAVCKPCLTRHHKSCKGTVEAPCGCESKVHAA